MAREAAVGGVAVYSATTVQGPSYLIYVSSKEIDDRREGIAVTGAAH